MSDIKTDAHERAGRSCGSCGLCCKIMGVSEIRKAAGDWCQHWSASKGCAIYADRPPSCRIFDCWYRSDIGSPEVWNPVKSRMVVTIEMNGRRFAVHVDPDRPDAWRREPYHAMLREYAQRLVPRGVQVIVYIGNRCTAVLPDRDVDLGICREDAHVVMTPQFTPSGVRWNAEMAEKTR